MSIKIIFTCAILAAVYPSTQAEMPLAAKIQQACHDHALNIRSKTKHAGHLARKVELRLLDEVAHPNSNPAPDEQIKEFQAYDQEILQIKTKCIQDILASASVGSEQTDELWNLVYALRDKIQKHRQNSERRACMYGEVVLARALENILVEQSSLAGDSGRHLAETGE